MSSSLTSYTCLDVDSAPSVAGIYAWYGLVAPSPPDWEAKVEGGKDTGAQTFRDFLSRQTARFGLPPLRITGEGNFAVKWGGALHDQTAVALQRTLTGEGSHEAAAPAAEALDDTIDTPNLRAVLAGALAMATPVFASPLYIGVAENLHERLQTHKNNLYRVAASLRNRPDLREKLQETDKNFAVRAVTLGFTPDNLIVWTLRLDSFSETTLDQDALRTVAEAAEWLLNRWHRPVLGRR